MGTDSSSQQSRRHGFSLVESAIVLAVVGLVIGGIWVASVNLFAGYRVSKTIERVLETENAIRYFFPSQNYESLNEVSMTLIALGVIPETSGGGGWWVSPEYAEMEFWLRNGVVAFGNVDYYSGDFMQISIITKAYTQMVYGKSNITASDCTQIARSILTQNKANSNFIGFQLLMTTGTYKVNGYGILNYTHAGDVICPSNSEQMLFYFKGR